MPVPRVIAISEFVRQQLIEVGVPEEKAPLVRHGVDTRRFFRTPPSGRRWKSDF